MDKQPEWKIFNGGRETKVKPEQRVRSLNALHSFAVQNSVPDTIVKSSGGYYKILPNRDYRYIFRSLNILTFELLWRMLTEDNYPAEIRGGGINA